MGANKIITVQGTEITIFQNQQTDYISLTDIARFKDLERTETIIQNWIRNRNTIELLVFGNNYTILILNTSNSMCLENKQD